MRPGQRAPGELPARVRVVRGPQRPRVRRQVNRITPIN
jgi:hypothetical protein